MTDPSGAAPSVTALFAERDARRHREQEAEVHLQQRREEELLEFRQRLNNFQLTDAVVESALNKIRRAFEHGETELMITSFPCSFCSDDGRAIINAGAPPINKPTAARSDEPEWLETVPAGIQQVYHYWRTT